MMPRPALAPSVDSGSKRIPAPFEPPDESDLSKVPAECHARRTAIGHALTCKTTSERKGVYCVVGEQIIAR